MSSTQDRRSTDWILGALTTKLDAIEKNFEEKFALSDKMTQAQFAHIDTLVQSIVEGQQKMADQFKELFESHIHDNLSVAKETDQRIEALDDRVLTLEEAPGKKAIEDAKTARAMAVGAIITVVTAVGGAWLVAALIGGR